MHKGAYHYERSGSNSPQVIYVSQQPQHHVNDPIAQARHAGNIYHNASASLPNTVANLNKDYVQINPPTVQGRSYNPHGSPSKSFSAIPAMEEINGSDYVCMSGGSLSKKLQQTKQPAVVMQQQPSEESSPQLPVKNEKSPVANIDLKTNYTTPANELPQAQYVTSANKQQPDTIAQAKQSVSINSLSSNSPAAVSPTPSNLSSGSGKSILNICCLSQNDLNILNLLYSILVKFKNLLPYSVTSRPGKFRR